MAKAATLERILGIASSLAQKTDSGNAFEKEDVDAILTAAFDKGFMTGPEEVHQLITALNRRAEGNRIIGEYVKRGLVKNLKEAQALAKMINLSVDKSHHSVAKEIFETAKALAGDISGNESSIETIADLASTVRDFSDESHSKPFEDEIIKAVLTKGANLDEMFVVAKSFGIKTGQNRLVLRWLETNETSIEDVARVIRELKPLSSDFCGSELVETIIHVAMPHLCPTEVNTATELVAMAEVSRLMIELYSGKKEKSDELEKTVALEKAIADIAVAKIAAGTSPEIREISVVIDLLRLLTGKDAVHKLYSCYMKHVGTNNFKESRAIAKAFLGTDQKGGITEIISGDMGLLGSLLGGFPGLGAIKVTSGSGKCAICPAKEGCPGAKEPVGCA